ncbi:profilin-like [Mytilus galloprovincialis]|uniref:profilin-like n=1 Tax=Mytilus galloprovincialis TaxID=29158 RepID=UPI003F7BD209
MSWDSYLDNLIGQSKDEKGSAQADRACIIGLDGGGKWTTDAHASALKLDQTEATSIANCFKKSDFSQFMTNGVFAEGLKYQFLREADGKIVYAKLKANGALTLQASKTAIVIAHTIEGGQHGITNKAVNIIADYLESMGM